MEPHATPRTSPPTLPPPRGWRDNAAEFMLCTAVAVIALTGIDPFVLGLNQWLASLIPAYDPMVTMLALVIIVVGALTLGAISLKVSVRRGAKAQVRQPSAPRPLAFRR